MPMFKRVVVRDCSTQIFNRICSHMARQKLKLSKRSKIHSRKPSRKRKTVRTMRRRVHGGESRTYDCPSLLKVRDKWGFGELSRGQKAMYKLCSWFSHSKPIAEARAARTIRRDGAENEVQLMNTVREEFAKTGKMPLETYNTLSKAAARTWNRLEQNKELSRPITAKDIYRG